MRGVEAPPPEAPPLEAPPPRRSSRLTPPLMEGSDMLLLFESLFIKFILSSAFPLQRRQPFLPLNVVSFFTFLPFYFFTFKKIFHFSFFPFSLNRRQPFFYLFTFLLFYL